MSSGHAKDFTFLGSRIPPEVESLSKNLKDVDQDLFRKTLKGKSKSFNSESYIQYLLQYATFISTDLCWT